MIANTAKSILIQTRLVIISKFYLRVGRTLLVTIQDSTMCNRTVQSLIMSQPQSILVVVQRHCTLRDNSDRIGRPRYKNLKIKKEGKKGRTLYKYIQATTSLAGPSLTRLGTHNCTKLNSKCQVPSAYLYRQSRNKLLFLLLIVRWQLVVSCCFLLFLGIVVSLGW